MHCENHRSWSLVFAVKEVSSPLFWDVTQHVVVIPYRSFGTIQELNFLKLLGGNKSFPARSVRNYHHTLRKIAKTLDVKTISYRISVKILLKVSFLFPNHQAKQNTLSVLYETSALSCYFICRQFTKTFGNNSVIWSNN
jgi:hypothetical protein